MVCHAFVVLDVHSRVSRPGSAVDPMARVLLTRLSKVFVAHPDGETRRRFACDLLNLTLAGPRVNRRQKCARDAAEWLRV